MVTLQPLFRAKNDLNWANFCNRNPTLKLKLKALTKMYLHRKRIKDLKR